MYLLRRLKVSDGMADSLGGWYMDMRTCWHIDFL